MIKEETKNTPFIYLSLEECKFEIKGNSYSEQAENVFIDIIEWVEKELPKLQCKLICVFDLSVINSVTYKNILSIFKMVEENIKEGKEISVDWYYESEDEENFDLAHDISELFEVPFNIIEKHDDEI